MTLTIASLFNIIITILILVGIIYTIIIPWPAKLICRYYSPDIVYEKNENANVTSKYTLYTSTGSKHDKLVIVFPGGAGLFSELNNVYGLMNTLNTHLGSDYDILTFSYPTRFKSTIQQSMLAINTILLEFIHYTEIHAIGISFGCLLAGAFYQKESHLRISSMMSVPQIGMKFNSFVGICGIYDTRFNSSIITWLFRTYIMHKTNALKYYSCYNMNIPKYIVSAKSDFLVAHAVKFIKSEQSEYQIYDTRLLPHAFPQFLNLNEARETLDKISAFIKKITKSLETSTTPSLITQTHLDSSLNMNM